MWVTRQMRDVGSPLCLEILNARIANDFQSAGYEDDLNQCHCCHHVANDVPEVHYLQKVLRSHVEHAADAAVYEGEV